MGKTIAAVSGFFVGSIVTAIASYYIVDSSRAKKEQRAQDFANAKSKSSAKKRSTRSVLANDTNINLMSDITARLWSHINVAGAAIIRETAEPMFKDVMPKPLQKLHFTKIDLGKVPFRFDNIIVHPLSKKDGTVQFDMDIIWDGVCDIQLKAGAIKFGVRNFKMCGRMQFLMKPLTDDIPCFGGIQYAFINPPVLDIDFTGLANVADFSLVEDTVRSMMNDTLASMMVLPNRMMTKMDYSSSFLDAYVPPVGVARITVVSGRDFEIQKAALRKDDVPDVYVKVKLSSSEWQTSVKKNNCNPVWTNESGDFLLSDKDQVLTLHAWDEDKGALDADDDLGMAQVTISEILLAGKIMEVELLHSNKKRTGSYLTIHCDILNLTTTSTETTEDNDNALMKNPPSKNHLGGLMTILITGAFNVPVKKEKASSYVKVTCGESHTFVTGIVVDAPGYDALNPIYDMAFHVPLTSDLVAACKGGALPPVVFQLLNGLGTGEDQVLGTTTITYEELRKAPSQTILEKRTLDGCDATDTSIEYLVSLSHLEVGNTTVPAQLSPTATTVGKRNLSANSSMGFDDNKDATEPSSLGGADATPSPKTEQEDDGQERVKVTMVNGHGFSITKSKKLFGKPDIPDVYCLVKFGSKSHEWRTSTIKNNVEPVWDESETYILSHRNEVIHVTANDENRKGDDDDIGSFRVTVGQVLLDGGTMEIELEKNGAGTGSYITLNCEVV